MSMDPTKWVPYDRLTERTRERIQQYYPYLKLDHCVFQEKDSGVFMKAVNNVKIEKLLDIERPGVTPPPPPPPPQPATTTRTSASGRRTTKA
ncbi:MAG TPA: hypothetical protein VKB51_16985 [bacterium]|nr:hypothetical protein [bacterium]